MRSLFDLLIFFFFNDTATTEIYTLSLHDALPISRGAAVGVAFLFVPGLRFQQFVQGFPSQGVDRKSTRLNSSHSQISYAVFCLKKKKKQKAFRSRPGEDRTALSVIRSGRCAAYWN